MAKADDRTMASMMRVVFRRGLHVSNSTPNPHQIRTDSAPNPHQNDTKSAPNQDYSAEPKTEIIDKKTGTDLDLKEEEKSKKKKRKKDMSILVETAQKVIDRVNDLRPVGNGFKPTSYHKPIGKLLAMDFTAEDMIAVVEWKAAECKRRADWQWFKPGTLFRSGSFAEKLDEAQAGVEITGQTGFAMTEGDQRAQRYSKRKAGKYPTHPVRGQS
jgi:uncharacterized phage protein (TIGR02220 family)